MNRLLDRIQICYGGSLGIYDDQTASNLGEESFKNKMADGRHFENKSHTNSFLARYLMNRLLDHIQI